MSDATPELPVVFLTNTIRETMAVIDKGVKGIALVIDDDRRLLGTITDGDVRRAILASVDLNEGVGTLLKAKRNSAHGVPVTAPIGLESEALLLLMRDHNLRQIPLLDGNQRVVGLSTIDQLIPSDELSLQALIMAGGYGTRLRPLTDEMPKPMLPVGDRPLLELIVQQLRDAGIRRVSLATHYKGEIISNHFKDGQGFGVEINYVLEDQPLGTAGALGLLGQSDEPILLINGDILTRVDFRAMLNFHREHEADLTVGVRQYEFSVPYGVVKTDGVAVTGISEKPILREFINAGIYLLNPSVQRLIPNGESYDIPDLIDLLVGQKGRVVCFPITEYWLDIGKSDHYDQAKLDIAAGRF
jgi:dTDP-glucose pyrophosphorylase/CBS domain-containing protein